METVVLDCDGVLLDWASGFEKWLYQYGLIRERGRDPTDFYYNDCLTNPELSVTSLIKMFNETYHISKLSPILGAIEAVDKLHKMGYVLKVCTSFSSNYQSVKMREQNLINVFGDVFADISAIPLSESKADYLKQQPKDSYFIDDVLCNVDTANKCKYSMSRLYLFSRPYNDPSIKSWGYKRMDWQEILNDITGE